MPRSRLLGVVRRGPDGTAMLAYLDVPEPVTDELLELAGPVAPTRVFRFAAPCAGNGCQHFDGEDCRLARRIVEGLPAAVDALPDCALRPACRWWRQEGEDACLRCPMIITESYGASEADDAMRRIAGPGAA